jgi:hypothetical protein
MGGAFYGSTPVIARSAFCDEAIQKTKQSITLTILDCFAALAMTILSYETSSASLRSQ